MVVPDILTDDPESLAQHLDADPERQLNKIRVRAA